MMIYFITGLLGYPTYSTVNPNSTKSEICRGLLRNIKTLLLLF
ncbi:Protein of unknown function [Pyronema omphalodes CBS 100304]|uniref:Uncharacterized protein n=1 Tax=Pyronema omphalodes (strain CBS 100304) TaxID=1076935 RepID=U4LD23_PYROM|nr:Protein of unknown function [Pyronema omphalodes CBS 100304]